MAKQKNGSADTSALAKELRLLIPKLDVEGLSFLVEQAKVHLYNMQVDKINRAEIARAETAAAEVESASAKTVRKAKPAVSAKA
jgi:hypothetical protein